MKYFMACINPECDQHLHPVSGKELILAANIGIPVIASINGDVPPVETAITALETLLESNPEYKIKDMAYEKLKSLQAQHDEECTHQSCAESEATETMGGASIDRTPTDDYYKSAEYKAHRTQMESLEVERMKAEISNLRGQEYLVKAKARLTVAEAQKLELALPSLKRVKPETN